MNLKQLEYFVHVAELGSFSKAALVLDIAQPALSRQVRALETDLRETLLLRNGRGVTLTQAGQRLFEHGTAILQSVAAARNDMGASRDAPTGRITVGLPPTLSRQLTLPLVDAFRRRCPLGRLAIVEGLSSHIVEWITTGRVDVGLMYNPEAQPALEITPVLEEPLCLVSPASASGGTAASAAPLRQLPDYPLIVPERGHAVRRLLETRAALAGVRLDIAWEVSSIAAIVELVCAGHGHAVLHASAVTASGRADQLLVRPLVEPRLATVLCLAASAHKRASPLMRQTSRLLVELARSLSQGAAAQSQPG
ncbi:LysR family transcriptional regulator [Aquabacterium sp. OR-4]|uniref:LysR family transcriptional regulator n=1 Tax=Aquabacterium sp. OR-4 TaxID=2978127 RepID=UPI0021B3C329|nr:LysR family transcriptional regulator [Aquabacterium sp. OR-4]MDT7834632.1 LysR family transcriptional regulator [Aquabacterium sp. OR-4]